MMKAIEKGCIAVITISAAGNEGKVVTVGNYIGEVFGFVDKDRWEIDRAINTNFGDLAYTAEEHCLMRIDDYDAKQETEQELVLINDNR